MTTGWSGARTVSELQSEVKRVPDRLDAGNSNDGDGGGLVRDLPRAWAANADRPVVGEQASLHRRKYAKMSPKVLK